MRIHGGPLGLAGTDLHAAAARLVTRYQIESAVRFRIKRKEREPL
jgi:hypothetical protein